jgi:hypothetical protein
LRAAPKGIGHWWIGGFRTTGDGRGAGGAEDGALAGAFADAFAGAFAAVLVADLTSVGSVWAGAR